MKKKLNQEMGFTLVEMLAATVILILLTMMLGTGLQMTVRSYQKITAQSEVELLLSTAMDALVDDLRFARSVERYTDSDTDTDTDSDAYIGNVPFTYTSDSFEGTIHLELNPNTGQIMAKDITEPDVESKRFLSTGVYGVGESDKERAYRVTMMDIGHSDGVFEINLEVQAVSDPSIKASGKVRVRCLNE